MTTIKERLKELSPCPKCGGRGEMIGVNFGDGKRIFFVECTECYVDTNDCKTQEEAIEKWEKGDVI